MEIGQDTLLWEQDLLRSFPHWGWSESPKPNSTPPKEVVVQSVREETRSNADGVLEKK